MKQEIEKEYASSTGVKISLCITTYNRANFLDSTLNNIVPLVKGKDNVEIVIVDGASTDNTAEVVRKFQKISPHLVYHCREKNSGVDRDMAKCIQLACGEYCWLFSDDDMLKPDAIERMLKEVESGCEIYLCNVTACTFTMKPIADRFWLSVKIKDRIFDLHTRDGFIEYCDSANSIGAIFSFWSSIVLKRREWITSGYDNDLDGSAYAMAASLISFINRKCRLKYIRTSLVWWRNDNQSFQMEKGLANKFLMDFNAYMKIADKYLVDDVGTRKAFLNIMKREHPWYTIIHVTSLITDVAQWKEFRLKLLRFGYSQAMVNVCYFLSRPKRLVLLGVALKRRVIRSTWIRRIAEFLYEK